MKPLHTLDELDQALTSAAGQPVLVFKHSDTCGMSAQARFEIDGVLQDPHWTTPVHIVSVQAARPVSNAVAQRFRVPHASPQLLLIRGGVVLWQASHLAITGQGLRAAVGRALDVVPGSPVRP